MSSPASRPKTSHPEPPTSEAPSIRIAFTRSWKRSVLQREPLARASQWLRTLCNGLCTAQRFHRMVHDNEGHCWLVCVDYRDDILHYNECPRLVESVTTLWRRACFRWVTLLSIFSDLLVSFPCVCPQSCIMALGLCLCLQQAPASTRTRWVFRRQYAWPNPNSDSLAFCQCSPLPGRWSPR